MTRTLTDGEIDALITAKADWAWTTDVIAERTGLSIREVRMAKARRRWAR